jgi:hypothetical protein
MMLKNGKIQESAWLSETQISSHLFEISLKLTIICYINLIKSITIINGWINISCTVDFSQNEPSFRNKSQ